MWVTLQCFSTLVSATNRAWGLEGYSRWWLPLRSLVLLGITAGAVLFGIGAPMLAQMTRDWLFPMNDFHIWVYTLGGFFIPLLVVFAGLGLFYRLAPRRSTRFSEVWVAALCATVLLLAAEYSICDLPGEFRHLKRSLWRVRWDHGTAAVDLPFREHLSFSVPACAPLRTEERSALADTIPAHKRN